MIKKENFNAQDQSLAELARTLSHPARIAILRFLASTVSCISGDISDEIPLSRTTVSQHLQELKRAGLIIGEIDGVRVNYCLNPTRIKEVSTMFHDYFNKLEEYQSKCC